MSTAGFCKTKWRIYDSAQINKLATPDQGLTLLGTPSISDTRLDRHEQAVCTFTEIQSLLLRQLQVKAAFCRCVPIRATQRGWIGDVTFSFQGDFARQGKL